MKRKTTNLIGLLLMTTMFVWGQTTHMVTSNADSGENTLRQIVEDAQGGDSIVISTEIAEIVLQSEISASKNLSINGQGATVKVAEAGVSPYRVLNFSFAEGNEGEVALYNLTLIGGDISGNGNFDIGKGGALFVKRTHLKLKNCFLNYGKAYNGGGLANGEGSFSLVIDSCYFSGNIGTNGHCAASLSFAGGMQIKNSVFEDNGTTAISMTGSGIDITQPGTISNCVFRANKTNGGRGGAALSVRNRDRKSVV